MVFSVQKFDPKQFEAADTQEWISKTMAKAVEVSSKFLNGMTKYQIIEGVVGDTDCPTFDSKYHQCTREITVRRQAITRHWVTFTECKNKLKRAELQMELEDWRCREKKGEYACPEALREELLKQKKEELALHIDIEEINMGDIKDDVFRLTREIEVFLEVVDELADKLETAPEDYLDNIEVAETLEEARKRKQMENEIEAMMRGYTIQRQASEVIQKKQDARASLTQGVNQHPVLRRRK